MRTMGVAFALLIQQPRVRISVLPIFLQLKYREKCRLDKWTATDPQKIQCEQGYLNLIAYF